ncbi:DUF2235 domain-containing protein [Paraburkholderia sp. CNPSo 3281]|uniref:T6SS phospholipase effector Tle1-like catalytic domain-containing protein n=1 Tax=Paraburkholderia sp. CNPSo 3281 TaxID=2940933 RepID=UPI0020B7EA02|nr:DUF2235 domain-containing protein [Paraburkholderia sp. CNPSo 3281]MCP3716888.1 DUF2235 domain-containing protein [Paraburkholderia sp. CNPSo 3281]
MSSLPQPPSVMQIIAAATRDVPNAPPTAKQDCSDVVHIAFFFDGTGNNRDADAAGQRWSNVARLFDASVNDPSIGTYSYYISGVGTPFNGEASWVDKPDVWLEDSVLGGAFGAGGDRRLLDGEDRMNQALRQALVNNARKMGGEVKQYVDKNRSASLNDLNKAIGAHRLIKVINISVIGFSRGAALSRAFVNMLVGQCKKQGDGSLTLNGFPVRFTFLGVFDTVASFGLPAHNLTLPLEQRDLRIPNCVERCVHFVAANELRYSFPVDLIREGGRYKAGWTEKVYPGVHSDIGGGYGPREQDLDGNYARIPMADMHLEALKVGVRLLSLAEIKATLAPIADRFTVKPDTQKSYQSYMSAASPPGTSVEADMKCHMKAYYESNGTLSRRKQPLAGQASFNGSSIKHAMWGTIDIEAPAYAEALKTHSDVVVTDRGTSEERVFFYAFKPEQWRLDAWMTNAPDSIVNFFSHYIHNSKVDFVANVEPFSYFRPRGVFEQQA